VDPISLIVAAIAAGVSAGVTQEASETVKDAYGRLKWLLRQKLGGEREVGVALEQYEQNPEAWIPTIKEELTLAGADSDPQLLKAAEEFLTLLDRQATGGPKYKVLISGPAEGSIIGDKATVTQSFVQGSKKL
jgi:hypothetical protein